MKTIVILGGGLAGLPVIRAAMDNIVLKSKDWKLVVVTPNTHAQFPPAMPRVLLPNQIPVDKVLSPYAAMFEKYPADKFEFILGSAEGIDAAGHSVGVALNSGARRTVPYDKLVIATGNSDPDGFPWKSPGTTDDFRDRVGRLQAAVGKAKTIVVAGGGPTGVELAGELGHFYSSHGTKTVYHVYSAASPLEPHMIEPARRVSKNELERLKIKAIPNSKVTKVTPKSADGPYGPAAVEVTGPDGKVKTIEADLYIPAIGLSPNTSFVPADMLNPSGYVKQTTTLQVEGQPDIFVIGDAGSLEGKRWATAGFQSKHLSAALPAHLLNGEKLPEYKVDTAEGVGLSLGPGKGTGQMNGWKLPGLLVWWLKSRHLLVDKFEDMIAGKP